MFLFAKTKLLLKFERVSYYLLNLSIVLDTILELFTGTSGSVMVSKLD